MMVATSWSGRSTKQVVGLAPEDWNWALYAFRRSDQGWEKQEPLSSDGGDGGLVQGVLPLVEHQELGTPLEEGQ